MASAPLQLEMESSKQQPLDGDDMLDLWDRKVHGDRLNIKHSGFYYRFEDEKQVLHEGSDDLDGHPSDITVDSPCILTSSSKPFTGTAVMRTMHLRPNDWYPEKAMHEFEGWEAWRDFPVYDNADTTDGDPGFSGEMAEAITVHHLLTHTSGWPFGLQGTREKILNAPLYFKPGTRFGYSIGHRILGWMLLDYWKAQPEGKHFKTINDVFRFLLYEPLGLTGTFFIKKAFERPHSIMGEFFEMKYFDNANYGDEDDPADLGMASTGHDLSKLTMMALRRGKLEDGSTFIEKWDEWAATNKLPGNRLSAALSTWRIKRCDCDTPYRILLTRTANSGAYGWSYFAATYHDTVPLDHAGDAGPVTAVGWKGFSSCGNRADYAQGLAVVVMQEIVPDPASRNIQEVIHRGMVGKYKFGEVARKLAATDPAVLELRRKGYKKACCSCCNNACAKRSGCNPCHCPAKCVMRVGYCVGLPVIGRLFKFHRHERVADKVIGETIAKKVSARPTEPRQTLKG